jgi:aspartate oxidase
LARRLPVQHEFNQFHPTAVSPARNPWSPAVRGEGGHLLPDRHCSWNDSIHTPGATRYRGARDRSRNETGFAEYVLLDIGHNRHCHPRHFPTVRCRDGLRHDTGADTAVPAAHYTRRVMTNLWRTDLAGLYAIGEVARTACMAPTDGQHFR